MEYKRAKRADNAQEGEVGSLAKLAQADPKEALHIGARLRNYLLTGLVVVGPVTITIYFVWWFIKAIDDWVKPFLPRYYNPDTYLPFPLPGIGLIIAVLGLTVIGALAANLIGRTLISSSELMLGRMPIVRNVYRGLKQMFESVVASAQAHKASSFQKVGLIEFPSKGIWSLVFITGDTTGEIQALSPGGEELATVFVPTGIVPPHGFVSFVPKKDILPLTMTIEDAAKLILSGGMVMPEFQKKLQEMAAAGATMPEPVGVPLG